MPRIIGKEAKQRYVEETAAAVRSRREVVVARYGPLEKDTAEGVPMGMLQELRRRLRKTGCRLRIIRNRLARRALKQAGPDLEWMAEEISGPSALVWAEREADPAEVCRILQEFSREHRAFQVRAAFWEGRRLGAADVAAISGLPPRPGLLAMLASGLQAPLAAMATSLAAPLAGLSGSLEALLRKKK